MSTDGEKERAQFRKSENEENIFNGRATTSDRMDKWRLQRYSLHQIGLGAPLTKFLTAVAACQRGGEVQLAEFRKSEHDSS